MDGLTKTTAEHPVVRDELSEAAETQSPDVGTSSGVTVTAVPDAPGRMRYVQTFRDAIWNGGENWVLPVASFAAKGTLDCSIRVVTGTVSALKAAVTAIGAEFRGKSSHSLTFLMKNDQTLHNVREQVVQRLDDDEKMIGEMALMSDRARARFDFSKLIEDKLEAVQKSKILLDDFLVETMPNISTVAEDKRQPYRPFPSAEDMPSGDTSYKRASTERQQSEADIDDEVDISPAKRRRVSIEKSPGKGKRKKSRRR